MNKTKEKHWEHLLKSNRRTIGAKSKSDQAYFDIALYFIEREEKKAA